MSRVAAMRSVAGKMGGSIQGAGSRAATSIQGAGTAIQGTAAYQGVAKTADKVVDMDINWGTIAVILFLGFFYMVIASLGIDIFSKCDELQGKTVQEYLNKWLIATLAAALAIPLTLFITKVAGSKKLGVFTFIYAIIGLIGSAATLNWVLKCNNTKDDESKLIYSGLNVASFSCVLLISIFLMTRKTKTKTV